MCNKGTSFSRYWQIRVDQIPCGTLYTPPMGCVQYHMDNYGNFKSFNFGLDDDYHTLASQEYAICIRRNSKMCRIAYNAADDGESFYMSQTPTVSKVRSRAGETGCPTDYITINDGSNHEGNGGICTNAVSDGVSHVLVSVSSQSFLYRHNLDQILQRQLTVISADTAAVG